MKHTRIVPYALRLKVFQRDGWHCHYCDIRLWPDEGPTVDHIVPKCRGGKNTLDNLVACCRWCNCAKGDMPYALFVALLEEVGHFTTSRKTVDKVSGLYHERMRTPCDHNGLRCCAVLIEQVDCC